MVRYFLLLLIITFGTSFNSNILCTPSHKTFGYFLAICYLQNIKNQEGAEYYIKDRVVHLRDVVLSVTRDKPKQVILTVKVSGAPEEFQGENILESEKNLAKYAIIYAYLAHQLKMNERSKTSKRSFCFARQQNNLMLDKITEITSPPDNDSDLVPVGYNFNHRSPGRFRYAKCTYIDRYVMELTAKFTEQEFDALAQHLIQK